ncbi:DUF6580 family putative transport protein [Foetidibacter luteolus]|uniref:DUF6580 family putative transport protein n=1 Tax=Foetidibacter luteolus TaxID=2608880 RepID=UPI00129B367C|nr:DUF6580 family putative transport protein [Foetidibacter luteolus]
MSVPKFNPRGVVLALFIFLAAALRLATNFNPDFGPLALFTPLGAMSLFGGAYFKGNIKPYAFPLLTLLISDLILSFTIYAPYRTGFLYTGWYWVYAAFALMTVAGKYLIKEVNAKTVLAGVIASVLIHWLVSDIGGCLANEQPSFGVYLQRLAAALPYELRFFAGTSIYSVLMFGLFEWMQRRYPVLQNA